MSNDYPVEPGEAERARRGDPEAFGRIVEVSSDDLYSLAWRMVYDREAARDLAQEAYLHLFRKIHLHEPGRPLRPWLLRVAARTMARRAGRSRAAPAGEAPETVDSGLGPPAVARQNSAQANPARERLTSAPTMAAIKALVHYPHVRSLRPHRR